MARVIIDKHFWVEHSYPEPGSSPAVRGTSLQGRSRGANGSAIILLSVVVRGCSCLCAAVPRSAGGC